MPSEVSTEGLRVLITNTFLRGYSGSELYARDVALALRRRGHVPRLYSPRLGPLADELREAGLLVTDDLSKFPDPPDLIHGQHHLECLTALTHYPATPAVYFCHGAANWLTAPPLHPRLLHYVAVSQFVAQHWQAAYKLPPDHFQVIHNFVDTARFRPRAPLPARPRRALVFSNQARADNFGGVVAAACRQAGLSLDIVGHASGNATPRPETLLGHYDLVFARGRSALESLAVGAAAICCDIEGLGPLVTSANLDELRRRNLGLSVLTRPVTVEGLLTEIARYDAADAGAVSARVRAEGSLEAAIEHILRSYGQALALWQARPRPTAAEEAEALAHYLRWVSESAGGTVAAVPRLPQRAVTAAPHTLSTGETAQPLEEKPVVERRNMAGSEQVERTADRLLVTFCNLHVPGLAVGVYDLAAGQLAWIDLLALGEPVYGATAVSVRNDGFWVLLQLAPNSRSGLAHLDTEGNVCGFWPLHQTQDAHHLVSFEGGFLVTDTQRNRLVRLSFAEDGQLREDEYWRAAAADVDEVHLNSVALLKGEVYVTLFGPKASRLWTGSYGGQVFNVTRNATVLTGLLHPHSLLPAGDALVWLESRRCQVHRLDLDGRHEVLATLTGYLRGAALQGDALYVAASAHRARSRSTGTLNAPLTDPDSAHSWLYRLHLPTRQVERRPLSPWGNEIYDLTLVPEGWLRTVAPAVSWRSAVTRVWALEEELGQFRETVLELTRMLEGKPALSGRAPAPPPTTDALREQEARAAQQRAADETLRELNARLVQRDQAIAWLRGEVALAQAEVRRMAESKFWRLGQVYWLARYRASVALRRLLPAPLKGQLRRWLKRPAPAPSLAPPPPADADTWAYQPGDYYSALTLRPQLEPEQAHVVVSRTEWPARARADIVCFSIIDWSFRYQRPQQLMSAFAAQGHRVFYINLGQHLPLGGRERYRVRPIKDNVLELYLAVPRPLDVYSAVLEGRAAEAVLDALDALRADYGLAETLAYVMVPAWGAVALEARRRWGWRLIYDCMDEWESFPGIGAGLLAMEPRLVAASDLLVVTAQRLYDKWRGYGRPLVLARNAVDYDFFAERLRPTPLLDGVVRPIVGYYGAIADWFDVDLLTAVAAQRPQYTFVLLGGVFDVDVSPLRVLPNVQLLGQQPYETMPGYLYRFDVCLIPFKVNPITQATDPVKLYEYLSAGKPVVAVVLAELEPYRQHLYLADGPAEFLARLDEAVAERDPARAEARRALAQANTWQARYTTIAAALRERVLRASLVVVTFNNLALTRLCLESVLRNTAYADYELIVVDNASSDGTQNYLRALAERWDHVRLVLNEQNVGFARANNQGLALATGDYLVLLNNDTVVPRGWLGRLLRHLADPAIGLVGPVTNFAGNEARLEVSYRTWAEMERFAHAHVAAHEGQIADIGVLAMYCVALRRDVHAAVGPLDERFGIGMFEDDDYTLRVRAAGYQVVCAPDVFVHHFGQAAFVQLIQQGTYDPLFETNRRLFEAKWGRPWVPHRHGALAARPHGVTEAGAARTVPATAVAEPLPPPAADYAAQVLEEKKKWGKHLEVEASGAWNAWLDHPLISAHYHARGLIEDLWWDAWAAKELGGPAERSLDLGCGAGARSLQVYQAGASRFVEGLDLSDDRVAEGERQRAAEGIPGRFWVEDVNSLRLPPNTYDLIFSAHSFHHFLNLEHILQEVANALTPRGLFILEEFVGPTQFQWTDAQLAHTRRLLAQLPPALRRYRSGQVKVLEGRPLPEEVAAVSPFESIRSGEIWPLFQRYFEVVHVRRLGGTVQHLLYNGIVHNFDPDDPAACQHLRAILAEEDRLIDSGELPSDFMLLVGCQPRGAAPA